MLERYQDAPNGVRGDRTARCLTCQVLVANRHDHERTTHGAGEDLPALVCSFALGRGVYCTRPYGHSDPHA